jgi:hypothetical protein
VAGVFLKRGRRRDPHSLTTKKLLILWYVHKTPNPQEKSWRCSFRSKW